MEVYLRVGYGIEEPGKGSTLLSTFVIGTDAPEEKVMEALFKALALLPTEDSNAYGVLEKESRTLIRSCLEAEGVGPNPVGKPASTKTQALITLLKKMDSPASFENGTYKYRYSVTSRIELYEDDA